MKIKITPQARNLVSAIEQCCIQGNTDDAEIYAQHALDKARDEGDKKVFDDIQILHQRTRKLETVLQACASQFRLYEKNHLAKTPPDKDKAETNGTFAEICEKVLA